MQTRFRDDMLHPARTIERPFYLYIYTQISIWLYEFVRYKIHMEIWACLDVEYASAAIYIYYQNRTLKKPNIGTLSI